jgi:excisionase family DNA binding protein
MADEKYLTIEEAATYPCFAKGSLYNLVHANKIPFHKIGLKAVRFKKDELDAWVAQKRVMESIQYLKKGDKYYLKVPGKTTLG